MEGVVLATAFSDSNITQSCYVILLKHILTTNGIIRTLQNLQISIQYPGIYMMNTVTDYLVLLLIDSVTYLAHHSLCRKQLQSDGELTRTFPAI